MRKGLTYLLILILVLNSFSCKTEKKINTLSLKTERTLKTDSIKLYNESSKTENNRQPKKTIFRNLEIDTTKLFGSWTQDPINGYIDFLITKHSFFIVDYDSEGEIPYIIDKNEIIVFYKGLIHKGMITSVKKDTLKIKWADVDTETEYIKYKN